MPIVLVIKEKGDVHSVLLTAKPIILGRSGSSDVSLSDDKVSGKHLALKLNSQGRVMIKDLETTNGTHLNGAQISEAYFMLSDQLLIGDVELSLDESQMTAKEKQILTREDAPTRVKYIRMPGEHTAPSKYRSPRPQEKPKPKDQKHQKDLKNDEEKPDKPTVVFDQEEKQKEAAAEAPRPSEKKKSRLVDSAKKLSKSHEASSSVDFSDENQYEMEQPTGATQVLKMSVKNEIASQKSATQTKRRPSRKKKGKPQKNKSILAKIIALFKGG